MSDPATGEHPVVGGQSVPQNSRSLLALVKPIATIILTTITICGIIGGAFAAYHGLQTRSLAKDEHATIRQESKDKRVEIRKEAKEERMLMKDEIITIVNRQHDQTREDFSDLRRELRAILREVRHNHGSGPR